MHLPTAPATEKILAEIEELGCASRRLVFTCSFVCHWVLFGGGGVCFNLLLLF